ncbi:MAG TPA: esterase family protein, partial [Saprospiraceae bacterium]|nr:esterase family protein [Saprospiraceae bacterium]
TEDRNNNGVIDAIDDTLLLIEILRQRGYDDDRVRYYEMEGGEHNPETWGRAMPDFFRWTL